MKRSTWTGDTIVYRYGCPSWARLPESAMAQLRLAHNLRNELVAVEYRYREMVDAIQAAHPEVAAAQRAVSEAVEVVERIRETVRRHRVEDRSTRPRDFDRAELAAARASLRDARAVLKTAKTAARESLGPALAEAGRCRYAALTTVRAEAVESGLFWATGNDVLAKHDTAAKALAAVWATGRAARRRRRPWARTGTLSTQVMWQAGRPRRTPAMLASHTSPWRNVFRLETPAWGPDTRDESPPSAWPKGRGPHRHGVLFLRIEKGADPIALPVVVHRPLPHDCDVTDVRLTQSRIGGAYRLSVAVTVRLDPPNPAVGGVPVSVVMGWAAAGDGAVRVARLGSPFGALPAPPPSQPELLDVLVPGDGFVDVVAPGVWRTLLERHDRIRGHRDDLLDELRPKVVEALVAAALAEAVGVSGGDVSRWRSPRRFAWLSRAWPADHPLAEVLRAWQRRDLHLWDYEAHERRQVIDRRRDAYRKVAAWVCEQASEIVLDCPAIAEVREAPVLGVEDEYPERAGRRQIQFAAPGDFRAALVNAAARRGVKVMDVRGAKDDG